MPGLCIVILLSFSSLMIFLAIRIVIILKNIKRKSPTYVKGKNIKTMIILGSGGHTGEMLKMVSELDFEKYFPRTYIIASTDAISCTKTKLLENEKSEPLPTVCKEFDIIYIPRSREVGQSWVTTTFTAVLSLLKSLSILIFSKPNLILCNGPGSCVPVCFVGFIFHIFGLMNPRIIFVESICRVKSLSLSGKLLYYICDDFFVQWPHLQIQYPRAQYLGRLF